jgi:hypothetical protein
MSPATDSPAYMLAMAANIIGGVAVVTFLLALTGVYLALVVRDHRADRATAAARGRARGRRRAPGRAKVGPRARTLRDDVDRLAQWVSARRRERAAADYHARVLTERTGIPAGGAR